MNAKGTAELLIHRFGISDAIKQCVNHIVETTDLAFVNKYWRSVYALLLKRNLIKGE
jgi:hypothetical protein